MHTQEQVVALFQNFGVTLQTNFHDITLTVYITNSIETLCAIVTVEIYRRIFVTVVIALKNAMKVIVPFWGWEFA